jgi:hypothetical protein
MWFIGTGESEPEKVARSIRESLQAQRDCQRDVLEEVSLLGRVVRVGKRAYTFCVRCGSVCAWQDSCMTSQGMTCGREIRYAPPNRYTELRQFVSPATTQMRVVAADNLCDMRGTLLCAPRATNTRADLFTRTCTPVFDDKREYTRMSLMRNRIAFRRPLALTSSDNAAITPPLISSADADIDAAVTIVTQPKAFDSSSATLLMSSYCSDEPAGPATVRVRPKRRTRKRTTHEEIAKVLKQGEREDATDEEIRRASELRRVRAELELAVTDEDAHRIIKSTNVDIAEMLVRDFEALLIDEQRERDALPMAKQHNVRPQNFDADEWQALSDEERFYRWTFEGRRNRKLWLYVRAHNTEDRDEQIARVEADWARLMAEWRASNFYADELQRLADCDMVREQNERTRRTLQLDAFTDLQVDKMRRFMIDIGAMPVRYEVCCAYCRLPCDPRGAYRAVSVLNVDRTLVDPRTNVPVAERGVVRIFLCAQCYKSVRYGLLRRNSLPMASDVFIIIQSQRAQAADRNMRKNK